MKDSRIVIEACVENAQDAFAAQESGADRIELNISLEQGGLSPSLGVLRTLADLKIPIICMVRPIAGGFEYDLLTRKAMLLEIESYLSNGADGIACGVLKGGKVDIEFNREIRKVCGKSEFVFHRAFDELSNLQEGLCELIEIGVDRILTSGGQPTAIAGKKELRKIVQNSSGRIEILPGAGVNASNAIEILLSTRCNQIHGSFQAQDRLSPPRLCRAELAKVRKLIDESDVT